MRRVKKILKGIDNNTNAMQFNLAGICKDRCNKLLSLLQLRWIKKSYSYSYILIK